STQDAGICNGSAISTTAMPLLHPKCHIACALRVPSASTGALANAERKFPETFAILVPTTTIVAPVHLPVAWPPINSQPPREREQGSSVGCAMQAFTPELSHAHPSHHGSHWRLSP